MHPLLKYKNTHGLTLKGLCSALGETANYEKALCDIVNGKRPVPATKTIRWAERTGIHPHKLRPDMFKKEHFPGFSFEKNSNKAIACK